VETTFLLFMPQIVEMTFTLKIVEMNFMPKKVKDGIHT
jgi:hypothetical protein